MPLLRRLGLLCAVTAGAAVLAGPVFAARPTIGPGNALPYSLGTPHFLVHYESDPLTAFAITQTQAGDVAARAERAYAAELADGYPAPPGDGALGGDARLDIYVVDLTVAKALGLTFGDNANPQTSSYVELNGAQRETSLDQHTIAHELFHQVQLGIWQPPLVTDAWLLEGSAEWMGYRVDAYGATHAFAFGPSDMSLDCRDPNVLTNQCDLSDTYLNNGYSRWTFFEYLTEKYGSSFLKDVFAQGAGGAGSAISSVSAALVAKGTTLADTYNAWALAELTSSYSIAALQTVRPRPYGATISTGLTTGAVTSQKVAVNHLSTRFLEFARGAGSTATTCFKATLAVSVAIPAGSLSQPVFYWDGPGSSALPLSISGGTATASIPWDTCTWSDNEGFLSLPNASQAVDAADFVVTASLTVTSTPATPLIVPSTPPPPVPSSSPVVPVSSADVAPTIAVFGPELLKLPAAAVQIRLIVSASGPGLLSAGLGSLALGTASLRAGNNDLRFAVPKGTLAALRRSAAASSVLTLTPLSAAGVSGTPVTLRVQIVPAKKPSRRK
jgi:hypothetical protein